MTGIESDLRIPIDAKEAKKICTRGKNSIIESIPHPKAHIVDGRVCVRIRNILKQTLALGVKIVWVYQPGDSSSNSYHRETQKKSMIAMQ